MAVCDNCGFNSLYAKTTCPKCSGPFAKPKPAAKPKAAAKSTKGKAKA